MDSKKAAQIMKAEIAKHCPDYHFKWNRGKRMLGQCCYTTKTLSLSKFGVELNSEEEIQDVILHEIAHALVGPGHNHNRVWKNKAVSIGCNGTRTAKSATIVEPNYVGICPNCKKSTNVYRIRKRKSACKECCDKHNGGKFSEKFVFLYKKWNKDGYTEEEVQ